MLISGGDPLLIPNRRLDEILGKLTEIRHLDLIRIGTRVPCVWPQRIIEDTEFIEVLRKHTPQSLKDPQLYINTHFNHPKEITERELPGRQDPPGPGHSDRQPDRPAEGRQRRHRRHEGPGARPRQDGREALLPVLRRPRRGDGPFQDGGVQGQGKSAGTSAGPRPDSSGRPTWWTRRAAGGRCRWISGIRTESARTKRAASSRRRSGSGKSTSTIRSRGSKGSRRGIIRTGSREGAGRSPAGRKSSMNFASAHKIPLAA